MPDERLGVAIVTNHPGTHLREALPWWGFDRPAGDLAATLEHRHHDIFRLTVEPPP